MVSFTPVLTPRHNFPGHSPVRFGIGEVIDLSFTTSPPGTPASVLGGLQWAAKTGGSLGSLVNGNDGKGAFTCGDAEGVVALELKALTNPGATKVKQFAIVAPNGATMRRLPNSKVFHRRGVPSAGFTAGIFLQPTDVSFRNLEFREGAASRRGGGVFFEGGAVGANEVKDVIHPVRNAWAPVTGGDSSSGSLVDGWDDVLEEFPMNPIRPGRFSWDIPWYVRVKGKKKEIRFMTVTHEVIIDQSGKTTISKHGCSVSTNLNDPDSDL